MKEEIIVKNCCGQDTYEHAKRVVELCEIFAKKIGVDNYELLIKAAWLHDIGKIVSDDKHDKKETIYKALEKVKYTSNDIKDMVYIIKNHKKKNFEPNRLQLECSILRISDKIDKFEKVKPDIIKTCQSNMNKIKNTLCGDAWLNTEFERIYNNIMNEKKKNHLYVD